MNNRNNMMMELFIRTYVPESPRPNLRVLIPRRNGRVQWDQHLLVAKDMLK